MWPTNSLHRVFPGAQKKMRTQSNKPQLPNNTNVQMQTVPFPDKTTTQTATTRGKNPLHMFRRIQMGQV